MVKPTMTPIMMVRFGCWFRSIAAVIVAVTVDNVEACSTAGIGMYCKA